MSFVDLIASATPLDEGGFSLEVPESWLQGRTAYGGLSAALALQAAKQIASDLPPLRSAQIAFVGPVTGTVEARPRLLRRGRNAVWIAVELGGDTGIGLVATFVFMRPLESGVTIAAPAPPKGLVAAGEAVTADSELRPAFLRNHFETRYALLREETKIPEICLWVRLLRRTDLNFETELLLVGDALPPAVLPVMVQKGPVSSMTWQVNFSNTPAAADNNGWWLLRSYADEAANGTSSQHMLLWDQAGCACASGTQTVAVFA